jgi:DNA (cytosine-5)-methyltransferase 1
MVVAARMVAFGEYSVDGTASAMKARDYKDATDLVAQPIIVHGTQDPCVSDIAFAQGRNNGGENVLAYTTKMHNTQSNQAGKFYEEYSTSLDANSPPPAVFQPIPINSMNALRSADADPTTGCGIGEAGEAMFTITKGHSHAVAQPIAFDAYNQTQSDTTAALRCAAGGVYDNTVAQPVAFQSAGGVVREIGDVMSTLDAARESRGTNQQRFLMQSMAVRRLTPVECERLQGFPDNYTNIPWRKKDESPDGPRYKALGNSWAVPVVRWIGKRIQEQINAA